MVIGVGIQAVLAMFGEFAKGRSPYLGLKSGSRSELLGRALGVRR